MEFLQAFLVCFIPALLVGTGTNLLGKHLVEKAAKDKAANK